MEPNEQDLLNLCTPEPSEPAKISSTSLTADLRVREEVSMSVYVIPDNLLGISACLL
jgi:hypothetical protein